MSHLTGTHPDSGLRKNATPVLQDTPRTQTHQAGLLPHLPRHGPRLPLVAKQERDVPDLPSRAHWTAIGTEQTARRLALLPFVQGKAGDEARQRRGGTRKLQNGSNTLTGINVQECREPVYQDRDPGNYNYKHLYVMEAVYNPSISGRFNGI